MKEKSPAWQWYPKQYLGDDKVLAMDWDARGMHVHLLNLAWQQDPVGSIPDDIGTVRRWLGLPSGFADADRVWARVWPQISAAWAPRDGRRFNSGLVCSWERQQTYKQNGSKRRAKGELSPEVEDVVVKVGFVLPDSVPSENWKGFEEMRKKIHKPMTDRAKRMIVKELLVLQGRGYPPGDVLDQSTRNDWQDVYELRNGNSQSKKTKLQESLDAINKL